MLQVKHLFSMISRWNRLLINIIFDLSSLAYVSCCDFCEGYINVLLTIPVVSLYDIHILKHFPFQIDFFCLVPCFLSCFNCLFYSLKKG